MVRMLPWVREENHFLGEKLPACLDHVPMAIQTAAFWIMVN